MCLHRNIFCDPSLELSHRDGSNEESQHMFSLKYRKKIELSSILPLIWSTDECLLIVSGVGEQSCDPWIDSQVCQSSK